MIRLTRSLVKFYCILELREGGGSNVLSKTELDSDIVVKISLYIIEGLRPDVPRRK
jgi:hypothetical protein